MSKRIKRVFLDYASTTPIDKVVLKTMKPYFSEKFGNPSAYYLEGLVASDALEKARENVAQILSVKPHEVIFTSSGTESDNLALTGLLKGIKDPENKIFEFWQDKTPRIITTEIEHPAIIETCKEIENSKSANVTYLPVSEQGLVNTSEIKNYFTPETVLVSIILANNEIGTIQSIRDISGEIKKYKNELGRRFDEPPYLHTDASQAPNYLDVNLDRLGVHVMTLDSSKIYGPKGVGCLVKKSYVPMKSIMSGGGQEFGLKPGTENVPLIVGFDKAIEIAQKSYQENAEEVFKLQKYFFEQITTKIPDAKINGTTKKRLPNNINICIPGLNSEFAVIQLDEKGVACSAMTACKSSSDEARSYVVDALYKENEDMDCGKSSLRFTLGKNTTKKDIDFAVSKLVEIV